MSAIVFAGNKMTVIANDVEDDGSVKSSLELPRVKSADELRVALMQYTAWLFKYHLVEERAKAVLPEGAKSDAD
jgi:hypothetical protein